MRRNKWKKAGLTVLSAVFMGSFSIAVADTGIPALAATKDVAVTEYGKQRPESLRTIPWNTGAPGTHRAVYADYQNQLRSTIQADPRALQETRC